MKFRLYIIRGKRDCSKRLCTIHQRFPLIFFHEHQIYILQFFFFYFRLRMNYSVACLTTGRLFCVSLSVHMCVCLSCLPCLPVPFFFLFFLSIFRPVRYSIPVSFPQLVYPPAYPIATVSNEIFVPKKPPKPPIIPRKT